MPVSVPRVAALATAALALLSHGAEAKVFNRIESFAVAANLPEGADPNTETSPEIIAASADGQTLIYTDSPRESVGFIDIADPRNAKPLGAVALDGEPTSVVVVGGAALIGINDSSSFTAPAGRLVALDLASREITASCDLGGQPDSVAAAPDGSFLAVAIENERDEDADGGAIPQAPGGFVAILPLAGGLPDCDGLIKADVSGLADVAPSDPEPEFVSINGAGEIAVTLQENNHIVILTRDGAVASHFSAGAVDLENVDDARDRALHFDGVIEGARREPDAVKWLDDDRLVTANEGDYQGGARGFTIFSKSGETLFESAIALEHAAARVGHYPEKRSGKKGVEPEGLEVGAFDGATYLFVLLERASLIGVYIDRPEGPELVQLLPSGVGPEGAVAIPARGLLATANEADLIEDKGARAHVMIYALEDGAPAFPQIESVFIGDRPIGWGALSGLAADPETPGLLYAVNDSFYAMQPSIFEIDATESPAVIRGRIGVTRQGEPAQLMDLEGIAPDGAGGFWLASEGRADRLVPHALYRVDARGEIQEQIPFPAELLAVEKRFGAEGVTKIGETLWIAIQREWKDDPKGQVKLVAYDLTTQKWGAVRYPLEAPETGWIGLSEITAHGDHVYIVERDNQIGAAAKVKRLYRVALSEMTPAPLGEDLPVVEKELVRDFLPDLEATNGFVVDKIEGFAIDAAGEGFAVTDNDGVDDSSGETYFFSIGKM